jgi:hypothetical protein
MLYLRCMLLRCQLPAHKTDTELGQFHAELTLSACKKGDGESLSVFMFKTHLNRSSVSVKHRQYLEEKPQRPVIKQ